MTYFEDKPFILQIPHDGAWWVSDWFDTPEAARIAGVKKTNPWRVIRYATGAVVSCGNPVWVHATTSVDGAFDIFDWNRWLNTASIMQLQVEVMMLATLVAFYAEIWELAEDVLRENAAVKIELFEYQQHAATIEIQKRLQSQYIALCEN